MQAEARRSDSVGRENPATQRTAKKGWRRVGRNLSHMSEDQICRRCWTPVQLLRYQMLCQVWWQGYPAFEQSQYLYSVGPYVRIIWKMIKNYTLTYSVYELCVFKCVPKDFKHPCNCESSTERYRVSKRCALGEIAVFPHIMHFDIYFFFYIVTMTEVYIISLEVAERVNKMIFFIII